MDEYSIGQARNSASTDTDYTVEQNQRLQHRLELQSLQIEQVLARHQILAEVDGGSVGSTWIDFDLHAQMSDSWQRLRQLKDELMTTLGVPDVRLVREKGALRLIVKKESPHPIDLLDLFDSSLGKDGIGVSMGVDEEGRTVFLDLSSPELSNILIAGNDDAGKSGLLRTIATSLAMANRQSSVQLGIIAAGNWARGLITRPNPLYPMNYLPHLLFPVVTDINDAVEALLFLAEEIEYRLDNDLRTPLLVLIIDDVDWLLEKGGSRIFELMANILQVPEDAGVRLLMSATHLDQGGLYQLLRHESPLRFVGQVADADQAFALTGEIDTGAENLNGRGDFLVVSDDALIRLQAAYIDDYDLHLTLSDLHRPGKPVLLAQPTTTINSNGINSVNEPVIFAIDRASGRATVLEEPGEPTIESNSVILEQVEVDDVTQKIEDIPLSFDEKALNSTKLQENPEPNQPSTEEKVVEETESDDTLQTELEYSDLDEVLSADNHTDSKRSELSDKWLH